MAHTSKKNSVQHNEKHKKLKIKKLIFISLGTILFVSTCYMLYSLSLLKGIENKSRTLISIDMVIVLIGSILYYFKLCKKNAMKIKIIALILGTLLYSGIISIGAYYINKTFNVIDNMTSSSTNYSSSLVTLSSNKAKSVKDIGSSKIGILKDKSSMDGYIIPKSIISENKIKNELVEYDSYITLVQALLDKKIDYIFLPTNYVTMFYNMEEVDFTKLKEQTKIIISKEKSENNKSTNTSTDLTKPFTVLVMGVDSEKETLANSSFNGDSLLLITFNPETLNTTMVSIPRDSYVPIACFANQKKSKITHAAWYGETCMMNTIKNYTGVNIDYFVKINFKGVVNIIDTLGGVDVDVPYSFCEQDSNRNFGNSTIYVREGLQKLNGEQALAFSRNRKSNSSYCSKEWTLGARNDFIRGQNQQLVLRAILNKLKDVRNLDTIYDILDKVSNSMTTNMSKNNILSLYNVGKDIIAKSNGESVEDLLGIQKLYLNGYDANLYDSSSGLNLYYYIIYKNSLDEVIDAMKVNLNLKEANMIKNFSFNIDKEYEETIIGKHTTGGTTSVAILPSFVGLTESAAMTKATKLGIKTTIKYLSSGSGENGNVLYQDKSAGTDLSSVSTITLTVLKKEENTKKIASDYTTKSSCNAAGYNWWSDGTCNATKEVVKTAKDYTTKSSCNAAGYNWWSNDTCNETEEVIKKKEASDYIVEADCLAAGYYWWKNNTCNETEEVINIVE